MLDPKLLRSNSEDIANQLKRRGFELDLTTYLSLEKERGVLQNKTQALQTQRNQLSKSIGQAKSKGEDSSDLMAQVGKINDELKQNEAAFNTLQKKLLDLSQSNNHFYLP